MQEDYNYILYPDIDSVVEKQWRVFEENNNCTVFQSLDFIKYWLDVNTTNPNITKNIIIFIFYKKELVTIIPLCIKKIHFNIKCLTWMGLPYNDICFPIIKNNFRFDKFFFKDLWKKIINDLKKEIDIVMLDNQALQLKDNFNPFLIFFKSTKSNANYKIIFDKNINYKSEKNLNTSSSVFKVINKLNRVGKMNFIFNDINKNEEIIKFIIDNKSKQFEKKRKDHLFISQYNRDFVLKLSKFKNSIFSYLSLDEKIIAAHIGYIFKDTFYHIMPTHNTKYNKLSPGKALLYCMIESSPKNAVNEFDFTIGTELYKSRWANKKDHLYSFLYPVTLKGHLLYLFFKFRTILIFKFLVN